MLKIAEAQKNTCTKITTTICRNLKIKNESPRLLLAVS